MNTPLDHIVSYTFIHLRIWASALCPSDLIYTDIMHVLAELNVFGELKLGQLYYKQQ